MDWYALISEKGRELLENALQGSSITISGAKGGKDFADRNLISVQKDLIDIKQNLRLETIKRKGGYVTISVLLDNIGLAEGYTLNQIGIYANTDSGEVLFALAQNETGINIPPESEGPYSIDFCFDFAIYSNAKIQLLVDSNSFITFNQFEEMHDNFIVFGDTPESEYNVIHIQEGTEVRFPLWEEHLALIQAINDLSARVSKLERK